VETIFQAKQDKRANQVQLYLAFHDLYRHFGAGGQPVTLPRGVLVASFDDLCHHLLGLEAKSVLKRTQATLIYVLFERVLLTQRAHELALLPLVCFSAFGSLITEVNQRCGPFSWEKSSWPQLEQWIRLDKQRVLGQRLLDVFLDAVSRATAESLEAPFQRHFDASIGGEPQENDEEAGREPSRRARSSALAAVATSPTSPPGARIGDPCDLVGPAVEASAAPQPPDSPPVSLAAARMSPPVSRPSATGLRASPAGHPSLLGYAQAVCSQRRGKRNTQRGDTSTVTPGGAEEAEEGGRGECSLRPHKRRRTVALRALTVAGEDVADNASPEGGAVNAPGALGQRADLLDSPDDQGITRTWVKVIHEGWATYSCLSPAPLDRHLALLHLPPALCCSAALPATALAERRTCVKCDRQFTFQRQNALTSVAITVPAHVVCKVAKALAEGKDPYPSQANEAVEGFVCPKHPDRHAYCAGCLISEAIPACGEVSWPLFCPGHRSVEVPLPKAPCGRGTAKVPCDFALPWRFVGIMLVRASEEWLRRQFPQFQSDQRQGVINAVVRVLAEAAQQWSDATGVGITVARRDDGDPWLPALEDLLKRHNKGGDVVDHLVKCVKHAQQRCYRRRCPTCLTISDLRGLRADGGQSPAESPVVADCRCRVPWCVVCERVYASGPQCDLPWQQLQEGDTALLSICSCKSDDAPDCLAKQLDRSAIGPVFGPIASLGDIALLRRVLAGVTSREEEEEAVEDDVGEEEEEEHEQQEAEAEAEEQQEDVQEVRQGLEEPIDDFIGWEPNL
jgi:hypothetical protein